MLSSKQLKCTLPFLLGYLFLSGEAIQVSNTIKLHTAFMSAKGIHSSPFNSQGKASSQAKRSIKMLSENDKTSSNFFNRVVGGGLLGFGLMNGGALQSPEIVNAADVMPAAETRSMAPRTQPPNQVWRRDAELVAQTMPRWFLASPELNRADVAGCCAYKGVWP